jgi:biotin synthase-related radical SAM superfamily protein
LAKKQTRSEADLPRQIRVSVGTAIVLELLEGKLDAAPTTAYLMTYNAGKCTANCLFCPQARDSQSKAELLSRVSWPAFPTKTALKKIGNAAEHGKIRRVCIQALNYPKVFTHLVALVTALKQHAAVPVSVSCQPLNSENTRRLAEAGADRIGIALDAATEKLFNQVKGSLAKGPYRWKQQFTQLREAVSLFGKGNVSTHLIVGLGETEKEAVNLIQQSVDMGVSPALFAFTPIRGTALENRSQPTLASYRRVQLARYLITNGNAALTDMHFDADGKITSFGIDKTQLTRIVESGKPFVTSGCPDCNRPFYNEKPSGPIYNYPRNLRREEISAIKRQLSYFPRQTPSSPPHPTSASAESPAQPTARNPTSCSPSAAPSPASSPDKTSSETHPCPTAPEDP